MYEVMILKLLLMFEGPIRTLDIDGLLAGRAL